jgi:hypothetical protein
VYRDTANTYTVQQAFDALTANSIALTTGTISTAPVSNTDIVNKQYADAIASGIHFHEAVAYATTAALPACTYNNGTSGVGATLTGNSNGALTVDSHTFTSPADNGTRVLIKNQANGAENGVYTLTQAGNSSPGAPFILTRATDFDTVGPGVDQIDEGDFFLVTGGVINLNTAWVQQTAPPITIGTTAIVFQQFSAPITYTAGTGLNESPSYTFNIANTAVTAATYGTQSSVGTFTVNAQGQITNAVDTAIAISSAAVSGLAASATTDTTNASNISSGTLGTSRLSGSYTGITGVGALAAGSLATGFTAVSAPLGGTGQTSYTVGDILYASSSTALSRLADVAVGNALISGGVAAAPSWGKIGLATHVDGTLPTTNGGTNLTSFTANGVVYASSTSALATGSAFTFSSGNVGIGTTAPESRLHVSNAGSVSDNCFNVSTPANDNVLVGANLVVDAAGTYTKPATSLSGAGILFAGINSLNAYGTISFLSAPDTNTGSATPITQMIIDADGNVGLKNAVTAPIAPLHIGLNEPGGEAIRLSWNTGATTQAEASIGFGRTLDAVYPNAAISGQETDTSDYRGNLLFYTRTTDADVAPTERMRIDSSGNINIATAGARITGDFSNATLANRVAFQSSTTNGNTNFQILPNGTATTTRLNLFNTTDTTNYSVGSMLATAADVRIVSDAAGTGTQLPLTFYTDGSERLRITSDGRIQINGAAGTATTLVTTAGAFPLTTAATGYNFRADTTLNAANTGAIGFGSTYSLPSTGGFGNSYQFSAATLATAGATLTNNFGFYCDSQTVGTNIYGFYSNIASGTNRYNFYANGTADNYFAGATTFANGTTAILDATNGGLQTFNSSGTWTKPGFGTWVRIQMWGGGGGGSRSGTTANIGAGGGGGYVEFTVPIASMGATATVTVGAAGIGRTGTSGSGTNGGNSAVTLGNGSIVYVSGGFGAINNNLGGNGGYGAITFSTTAVEDPSGNGSGASATVAAGAGYSYTGGGGGTATNNVGGKGGYGGGGGTRGITTGNTSIFGGDGGTASVAGTQPGGGGGASSVINTNATNGGAGRVIITTY